MQFINLELSFESLQDHCSSPSLLKLSWETVFQLFTQWQNYGDCLYFLFFKSDLLHSIPELSFRFFLSFLFFSSFLLSSDNYRFDKFILTTWRVYKFLITIVFCLSVTLWVTHTHTHGIRAEVKCLLFCAFRFSKERNIRWKWCSFFSPRLYCKLDVWVVVGSSVYLLWFGEKYETFFWCCSFDKYTKKLEWLRQFAVGAQIDKMSFKYTFGIVAKFVANCEQCIDTLCSISFTWLYRYFLEESNRSFSLIRKQNFRQMSVLHCSDDSCDWDVKNS